MKNITINIPDMQSSHCQSRVNNAVNEIEGVQIQKLEAGKLTASIASDNIKNEVEKAINKAGYTVSSEEDMQFKTNINCGGCVATVKPHLDNAEGICHWDIDTANKDKILSVHSEGITKEQVLEIVKKAGFTAEPLST